MRFVIDASVAVEYLLRTPLGQSVSGMIEASELIAPELLDVEVMAVLRREVMRGAINAQRAEEALDDLGLWPIERVSHSDLIQMAWSLGHNISAYDAMYVAAAALVDAPVLTSDGPLARAPSLGVAIQNVRV